MTAPRMRAGNTDRQAAVDRLSRHFTDGRLDPSEFEDRVGKAYAATHLDQLPELLADLPEDLPRRPERPVAPPWAGPPRPRMHRPPPFVPIIVVLALILSFSAVANGFFPFPIFWVLLVLFFIATGRRRRYGHYHHASRR